MSAKPKHVSEILGINKDQAKPEENRVFSFNYSERDLHPLFQWRCEDCQDKGWIIYTDGKTEPCSNPDCQEGISYRRMRSERTAKISHVPEDFQGYKDFLVWEQLQNQSRNGKSLLEGKLGAILVARYMVDHLGKAFSLEDVEPDIFAGQTMKGVGLMLYGGLGVGKTALACTVANVAISRYHSAMFVYVPRWLEAIKDSFGGGPSMVEFNQLMLSCDCLILDDCNVPSGSDFNAEKLEIVVRERSAKRKPYIITTNLQSKEEFTRVWGGQAWDIIAEKCLVVGMAGEPLRQKHDFGIVV